MKYTGFILLVWGGLLPAVVSCTRRPAPEKPLSAVLREERVAIPKGRATPPLPADSGELQTESAYEGIPVGVGSDGRPYIGADAPSLIIWVFSDIQCPFCRVAHEKILSWARQYGREVRFVFYHFPLPFHPYAMEYARIAVCAARMGRFWSVVHALFNAGQRHADVHELARRFGLDGRALADCSRGRDVQTLVDVDIAEARRLQVGGTPTFVVNGETMYMDAVQMYLESKFK